MKNLEEISKGLLTVTKETQKIVKGSARSSRQVADLPSHESPSRRCLPRRQPGFFHRAS